MKIFFKHLLNTKPPPCPPIEKGGLGEGKGRLMIIEPSYSINQRDMIFSSESRIYPTLIPGRKKALEAFLISGVW